MTTQELVSSPTHRHSLLSVPGEREEEKGKVEERKKVREKGEEEGRDWWVGARGVAVEVEVVECEEKSGIFFMFFFFFNLILF